MGESEARNITCGKEQNGPLRDESRGFMSKMSTPCILPKISNRSRPVACSRSVGMVPGGAPGPRRSSDVWISVYPHTYISMGTFPLTTASLPQSYDHQHTFELLDLRPDRAGTWRRGIGVPCAMPRLVKWICIAPSSGARGRRQWRTYGARRSSRSCA